MTARRSRAPGLSITDSVPGEHFRPMAYDHSLHLQALPIRLCWIPEETATGSHRTLDTGDAR